MEKTRIVLVGEDPLGSTGNSGMMYSIIGQLNAEKYDFSVLSVPTNPVDPTTLLFSGYPFSHIDISLPHDLWGNEKLLDILARSEFDILLMVGIDIWRYSTIFQDIIRLRDQKGFKWGMIFPYDLQNLRKDWVELIDQLDFPCVYSMYGFDMLKDHVPQLQYFRPPLRNPDIWKPFDEGTKLQSKRKFFSNLMEERFIFAFIGQNQFRKDPVTLLKAFAMFKEKYPNKATMYFHFDLMNGVFNLKQLAHDYGLQTMDIFAKRPGQTVGLRSMPVLYNAVDCLVNCTLQEGLSWTVIEAMLCGVPVIASDSTAHPELFRSEKEGIEGLTGYLVPCEQEAFLPTIAKSGSTWVEAKKCNAEDIFKGMEFMYSCEDIRKQISKNGVEIARRWLEGTSNINGVLHSVTEKKAVHAKRASKKDVILFCQHSAAGDIFMTTRCLKGLRERHPDIPLHYMTQDKYFDILVNNPHIDKLIPWNEGYREDYKYVYNPHGDIILPGHWGRNCNSILSDFYWKILDVEPDDFFIEKIRPFDKEKIPLEVTGELPMMVVHTTGGDPQFRTYKYMKDVCDLVKDKYFTVQVGAKNDYPAGAHYDLRGLLTFRETAWVMDRADIAITVDSFISHLAGALGIDQVCLFGSGNYLVVRPNQISGTLVCMVPDYVRDCKGLGPCSASVRDCPAPCTGKHNPLDILMCINTLERSVEDHILTFRKDKNNAIFDYIQ